MFIPVSPPALFEISPTPSVLHDDAHRRSLHRLLQALFREGLLNRADFVSEGDVSWLPLWGRKLLLRIEGLDFGRLGHCQIRGRVSVHQSGQTPRVINSANELLGLIW